MKRILILFFLLIVVPDIIWSQDNNLSDSVVVDGAVQPEIKRSFDPLIITELKSGSQFIYEQPPETRPNFLRMLFSKILGWLVMILGSEGVAWVVLVIILLVGVVGFGFALYGLFGIGKTMPIYNKESDKLNYNVKEENIHEVDFSEEIDTALEQKDFRRAIRLLYLYALKLLSNHKVIEWLPSKTNHDYQYEIQNEENQRQFTTLSYYFEYVWYGEFKASATQFSEMKSAFSELEAKLKENAKS